MSQDPMIIEDPTPEERAKMAGQWLQRERIQMGWSQETFARQLRENDEGGPVANTIARWERGENKVSSKYGPRIADVLGMDVRLVVAIMYYREVERIPDPL